MITKLCIENLLFVEKAEIHFAPGLNIITGETGAGKSAILSAISLLAGQRSDLQMIGNHKDLCIIEASLAGVLIRRELHKSGKSRCFINDELVSLTHLRQVTSPLIEVIDQASSHLLCTQEMQRNSVDSFGGTTQLAEELRNEFAQEEALQKHLTSLVEEDPRLLSWMEEDLGLIEEVNWKEGEEESLVEEHHRLTHAQEFAERIASALEIVEKAGLKKAISLVDIFPEISQNLKTIVCELDEVSHELHKRAHLFETSPERLEVVEERMRVIDGLKRRFGKTLPEVTEKKRQLQDKIEKLTARDEEIAKYTKAIGEQKDKNQKLANRLSQKRAESAANLQKALLKHLPTLNLPHAKFQITCTEVPLTAHGIDMIEFLFSANPDRAAMPMQSCASGGELSRVFLSLKTVLADKDNTNCLVFDEIDGNVGGQTAVALGEKLKMIAKTKQVICVTHFVQVAKLATKHFVVVKKQLDKTTLTQVEPLEGMFRESEYQRMLGQNNSKLYTPL